MSKVLIIMGSSNPYGDTYEVCNAIVEKYKYDYQDLNELVIMHYDYEYENNDDDFLPFMRQILPKYDAIVLATPIYWYTMSGLMKNFIDRFTDLLVKHKKMGHQLRGKNLSVVSVSKAEDCPEEFHMPLKRTNDYLGMTWKGHFHFPVNDKELVATRIESLGTALQG